MRSTMTTAAALTLLLFIVRIALGWQWLDAGLDKAGSEVWTGSQAGVAATGFLQGALEKAALPGPHPEVQDWYATLVEDVFLPQAELFSWFVVVGQIAVAIALFSGVFTKLSAGLGMLMSLAFLLAGTSSTNPQMILLASMLILAPRPGAIGADAFLMPALARRLQAVPGREWGQRLSMAGLQAGGILLLGFTTYTLLESDTNFAVTWAAALVVGSLWLVAIRRLDSANPSQEAGHEGEGAPPP